MADLVRVHFFDPATWRVGGGWLSMSALAVVRPVVLDLSAGLCSECVERLAGRVPRALAVRLVDGSQYVVLGDGRSADDARDLSRARRLVKVRARCEQAQHREAGVEEYQGMRSLHAPRT